MAITINTITTSTWDALYSHLQTGTYALSTDNIFSAYNDKLVADVGLPIIIIEPPSIGIAMINKILKSIPITFNIHVFNSKAETVKSMTDEIVQKLVTGYSVLADVGLKRPKDVKDWIESLDYVDWQLGKRRIHRYTIAINFKYVGET